MSLSYLFILFKFFKSLEWVIGKLFEIGMSGYHFEIFKFRFQIDTFTVPIRRWNFSVGGGGGIYLIMANKRHPFLSALVF